MPAFASPPHKALSSHGSFYRSGMPSPTPSQAPTTTDDFGYNNYKELVEDEDPPFANLSLENKLKVVIVGTGFGELFECTARGRRADLGSSNSWTLGGDCLRASRHGSHSDREVVRNQPPWR